MRISVHHFTSTGSAYDSAMSDDEIEIGDVLVIKSERVVGLCDAWPVAVTVEAGQLHHVRDDLTLEEYGFEPARILAAENIAIDLGFPLNKYGAKNEQ